MATQAQINANRSNALQSTGPVTADGKRRSSMNACKHGLYAQAPLVRGESEEEFLAFQDRLMASLAPADAFQSVLATKVVHLSWMLRRMPGLYAKATEDMVRSQKSGTHLRSPMATRDAISWMFQQTRKTNSYAALTDHEARLLRTVLRLTRQLRDLQKLRDKHDNFFQRNEANPPGQVEGFEELPPGESQSSGTRPTPVGSALPDEPTCQPSGHPVHSESD